jgi:hypothetical protein
MAYLHAFAISIFGATDLGFRIFDVLFQIGTCYLLIIATRRYISRLATLITPIVYCLIYTSLAWSAAGQVDAFVAGFLLAGLLLIRRAFDARIQLRAVRTFSLFFGGVLVAFCTALRPTYLLFPAALLLLIALDRPRRHALPSIFFGCSTGVILPLTPYLFFNGGPYAFYTQALRYGIDVYGMMSRSPMELWASQRTTILMVAVYLFLAIVTGIFFMRRNKNVNASHPEVASFDIRLYMALIVSCIISVLIMRKFLVSHFLPLLALLSPLIASGITSPIRLTNKRPLGIAVSAILCLFFAYRLYPRNLVRHFIDGTKSPLGALVYCYDKQASDPRCGYLAELDAATYLNKIDPNSESIEVVSCYRSYMRVQCNLEGVTKYSRTEALATPQPNGLFTGYQQEWRSEYLNTLRAQKPRIIVEADNGFRLGVANSPLAEAEKIVGFADFFEHTYERDTAIHGFTFYRRRDG